MSRSQRGGGREGSRRGSGARSRAAQPPELVPVKVAVTGASGFVGSALAYALSAEGHDVTAVTRHPERYHGAGRPAGADIRDRDAIERVLAGHDAAYFLVHSLTMSTSRRRTGRPPTRSRPPRQARESIRSSTSAAWATMTTTSPNTFGAVARSSRSSCTTRRPRRCGPAS